MMLQNLVRHGLSLSPRFRLDQVGVPGVLGVLGVLGVEGVVDVVGVAGVGVRLPFPFSCFIF